MKRILFLSMLMMAAACTRYDIDEILVSRNDISLTWKGEEQFVYEPQTCQIGFNPVKGEFRAQADNLSSWFVMDFDTVPSAEGEVARADISWTGATDTRSMNGLEFQVRKVSGDGMIWLWCKSAKIGVTIRKL